MRRYITFSILLIIFTPLSRAQYWDWVTDAKSMEAFTRQYLDLTDGQLGKMAQYLAYTELIKEQHQAIADKVRYIHMVRDSLFKSLQDVRGIKNAPDERIIRDLFGQVEAYYGQISNLANKHPNFKETWTLYDNYVISHSNALVKFTDMAVKGGDEKNLLDKEQRLFLLSYVVYDLKRLREISKRTLQQLIIGDASEEYSQDKLYQQIDNLYSK
jgi:hypothetical protein